jgi:UDP-N-acetylmuramoyl-L-alanyl-D-glutamate--2,6-diaminopimelate ligase
MSTTLPAIVARLAAEGLLPEGTTPERVPDVVVSGLTTDSRVIGAGALFCAIRGTSTDGHDFLDTAAQRQAAAALVLVPNPSVPLRQIVVRDDRLAAAYAGAEFFADPWRELRLVGVTGTNGKTTTAALLRHLLGMDGPAASIGTLGVIGADGTVLPGTEGLTTPGPIDFARWLRGLKAGGVQAVAMEVSSHALAQSRVAAARFDAAVFTNLTRDHLDYHGTLEEYRDAKLKLLDHLKPGGAAVLNADDPVWSRVAPAGRTVRFGIGSDADVRAEDVRLGPAGTTWSLRTPDGTARVDLPLLGTFNVANALGVSAALWALGWSAERIAGGLATLPQVPGRLERVPTPQGAPTVLIDYAHTPDALQGALTAVRRFVRGRLVVVFGAGGDRDRGKRPEMGRVAAQGADLCVVTSDNPRTEDPDRIAQEIESGMGNAPRRRVIDRREAIRYALQNCSAEDIILLAGKGHETYQIWGTERREFDERIVVNEIMDERGGAA